jgi:hypothetical protein
MEKLKSWKLEECFARFERAAGKGHEESIWILSVWKDAQLEWNAVIEACAKTEAPLGWWFVGELSDGREQFDLMKKSAEGGCSWGQVAYGDYFEYGRGGFVEKDMKASVEWLEKAANQNSPQAMEELGHWFRDKKDMEKAVSFYRAAAELGWKDSMGYLAIMLKSGNGCAKDLRQAAIWGAKEDLHAVFGTVFWSMLGKAKRLLGSGATEDLDCDFNQLCYALGWGLFWYQYESWTWKALNGEEKVFSDLCLDFYCSCVEMQQKSIFTFLWFWNRTTGVKGPGQMIAQMVWRGREDNLVKMFEEHDGEEPETKRIKK